MTHGHPDAAGNPAASGAVVTIHGLRKHYAATQALAGVDLELRAGEVYGLVGANGAGKSTLIRILAGAVVPDAGEVLVAGVPLALGSPRAALRAGIVTVHQQIDAGHPARPHGGGEPRARPPRERRARAALPAARRTRARAREIADRAGLDLPLDALVDRLGSSDRQQIVLARALAHEPRLLVLDEPTSALSERETERLFATIRRMIGLGVGVLYVSHRLPRGRRARRPRRRPARRPPRARVRGDHVGARDRRGDPRDRARRTGRPARRGAATPATPAAAATTPAARRSSSSAAPRPARPARRSTSSWARARSSGLFGLVGAGKTVAARGAVRHPPARRRRAPRSTAGRSPPGRRARPSTGACTSSPRTAPRRPCSPDWSIAQNLSLPFLRAHRPAWLPRSRRRTAPSASRPSRDLGVVAAGPAAPLRSLSGGNQQKVVVGRWLGQTARLLLLDEPFRGVDLGARADIGTRLRDRRGAHATLVASADVDELLEVADRVVVLHEGAIVHDGPVAGVDREALVHLAAGGVGAAA